VIRRVILGTILAILLGVAYLGVTFVQVVLASGRDEAASLREGGAQAIVVLGAAQYDGTPSPVLRARLDHAVELYEEHVAPVVVLTGGRQPGDRFTEASAGAAYLRTKGVPESALRLESQGTNTWESLAAAAQFLREEKITHVVLVSSPYHSLRIKDIAGEVGLDGLTSPSVNVEGFSTTASHVVRETIAVAVGRVIGQRRLVDLDTRVGRSSKR
jgi:uncharacterized SAM-binding protein YcdF (DUF218 family)